jgi:DNA-binding CsgD family transcriptional regulator
MASATTAVPRRGADRHTVQSPSRGPAADGKVIQALSSLLGMLPLPPATVDEEVVLSVELEGTHYSLAQWRARPIPEPVKLSAREREVARLISAGHTNKTVAAVLDISLWTVDTHIRRIFAKLGVRSRSAMVAHLAELGLIGPSNSSPSLR